jgi:hypothetical protein
MEKLSILTLTMIALSSFMATTVLAQNVHLKGGANAKPTFSEVGLLLRANACLAGLGNGDVEITLTATADVESTCTNKGGNQAPGQNPAEVTVRGSESIPQERIENGNLCFLVTTEGPRTPIPGAPGCPNGNWRQDITALAFTSAIITVEQPAGTKVLTVTCEISPPTSDGPVPGGSVDCIQVPE